MSTDDNGEHPTRAEMKAHIEPVVAAVAKIEKAVEPVPVALEAIKQHGETLIDLDSRLTPVEEWRQRVIGAGSLAMFAGTIVVALVGLAQLGVF